MSGPTMQDAQTWMRGELGRYQAARRSGDVHTAWRALERIHIVAQRWVSLHLWSHWQMLRFAVSLRDWREAAGQIFRLALVPLDSLTGRLPVGNIGRAHVSAFRPMPLPPELASYADPKHRDDR